MVSSNDTLSEREIEILELVAQGATNQQIARELFISVNTVKVHLRNIFVKLGAESRTEATMTAIQRGLIRVETPPADSEPFVWPVRLPRVTSLERIYLLVAAALVLALVLLPLGGDDSNSSTATGALLDSSRAAVLSSQRASSRWKSRAPLPGPRGRLAVVAVGDAILAIGGVSSGQVVGTVEAYLPAEDLWLPLAAKPTPVGNVGAVNLDGLVYVPGGYDASGRVLDVLEVYDVEAGSWMQGPSLPAPRCAYAVVAVEGQMYLFGGWDGKRYTNTVFRYDPAAARWEEVSPMPLAVGFQAAAVVDGKVYLIGGYDGAREYASCHQYDPSLEGSGDSPWTERTPMSAARGGAAATAVGASIYVIGGGWDGFLAYNERYEPRSDTWVRFESPLTGQWRNLGVAPFGTRLYAVGGWSGEDLDFTGEYQAIFRIVVPHTVR